MKQIVFTIAVGSPKYAHCALGLGRSLKLVGDTTRRVIITDQLNHPWDRCFDQVLEPKVPFDQTMLSKLTGLDRLDADQVLFLDCDCLVFKRLDRIFDHCAGRGLCVQGYMVQDGEWYGNVQDHLKRYSIPAMPKFNGGLIYYERTPECQELLSSVFEAGTTQPDPNFHYESALLPEEPYLSVAMAQCGIGKPRCNDLIPQEMAFTNSAMGLIGRLDLDVYRNRCSFLCLQEKVRFVEPTVFHASRYIHFAKYWRQLDRLERLEAYEISHEYGYMSPWHRFQRSVQRRYLKHIKRIP